jgi:two-component system sensor histidine kinase RegB
MRPAGGIYVIHNLAGMRHDAAPWSNGLHCWCRAYCGNSPHHTFTAAAVRIAIMKSSLFAGQTGHHHLRRLIALRGVAVAAQCLVLALAYYVLDMQLPWPPLLAVIAALFTLNLVSWWRLGMDYPVTNPELFAQLVADVLALAALLYFSGGSTNPFISLFLLPLVIAAAALPRGYTWGMAALTTACYTLLMKFYVPLPLPHSLAAGDMNHGMEAMDMNSMPQESIFNLHVFGMWLGFVLSAAIIAFFVVKMAQAVRERDESLARVREENLRNERIVSLGTLAAGAAHELGTPLSTMSVVIGELLHEADLSTEWQDSLKLLDGQVRNCRRILDKMLDDGRSLGAQPLENFLSATLEEWRLLRPATECAYSTQGCNSILMQNFDPALRPALLNLLNNAADASPQRIEVEARCSMDELTLTISDHGPGLTAEAASRAGSAFFTTKQNGRGLGLFLANATLERLGGRVRLFNRAGGGAATEVTLPLRMST